MTGVVQLVPAFQDSSALRSQLLLEPLDGLSLARSWSSTPSMACVWLAARVGDHGWCPLGWVGVEVAAVNPNVLHCCAEPVVAGDGA